MLVEKNLINNEMKTVHALKVPRTERRFKEQYIKI